MNKEYITVAEWTSNNEIEFAVAGKQFAGKTPQYCESRVKRLFLPKHIVELHLRGWHIQIRTIFADSDPMSDWVDVDITFLHNDIDTIAIESKLIHKMLANTQIQFREATDTRSPIETLRSIDV